MTLNTVLGPSGLVNKGNPMHFQRTRLPVNNSHFCMHKGLGLNLSKATLNLGTGSDPGPDPGCTTLERHRSLGMSRCRVLSFKLRR